MVRELLELHYDPLYLRSQTHNYTGMPTLQNFSTDDLSTAGIARLAEDIAQSQSRTAQIA